MKPRPKRAAPMKAKPRGRPDVARPLAFPVVGIGASAGGLESLQRFMSQVSPSSGQAFVVVQHMAPTHPGLLAELLQHATPLPVVEVESGVRVKPNRVYVIPPNKNMAFTQGTLQLSAPTARRGLRLPIDYFFSSLADALGERCVGVLLSGMGSDGTNGMAAMAKRGGALFVESPASAKFDAMPRSALDAGLGATAAPVEELPELIASHNAARGTLTEASPVVATQDDAAKAADLRAIVSVVREVTGRDFSHYKRGTVERRIDRRRMVHGLASVSDYAGFLRANPKEAELLLAELMVGVTSFFRDPAVWAELEKETVPELLAACPEGSTVRAWVPACSTGEEAYSLAIVLHEAAATLRPQRHLKVQLFATDLDAHAIDRARQGVYPKDVAKDVGPTRLRKFFVATDQGYRIAKEIRDCVVFATHDLLQDPPLTKLQLLSCRNLLIYLDAVLQEKVIPLFHYALAPGGILVLGAAETTGTFTHLFSPATRGQRRIYRRVPEVASPAGGAPRLVTPAHEASAPRPALVPRHVDLRSRVERFLLGRYAPAAVLTSQTGDVLYVSGKTGAYLELPAGKVNWNVLAMARKGLRHPLAVAFQDAVRGKRAVTSKGLRVVSDGATRWLDVTVEPMREAGALANALIVIFVEGAQPTRSRAAPVKNRRGAPKLSQVTQALAEAREDVRLTREAMRASQEELEATNRELWVANEELQSANEELTTSKEESQSMNEELQTLNHELETKLVELSRASNDMENLLESTEIAVLFLDRELRVRRFTAQAATLIKLIPGDVGRPLADLASTLAFPALFSDAREVLRTLAFKERTVVRRDGRELAVRIMPYRTSDHRIEGLVITFTGPPRTPPPTSVRPKKQPKGER